MELQDRYAREFALNGLQFFSWSGWQIPLSIQLICFLRALPAENATTVEVTRYPTKPSGHSGMTTITAWGGREAQTAIQ